MMDLDESMQKIIKVEEVLVVARVGCWGWLFSQEKKGERPQFIGLDSSNDAENDFSLHFHLYP